MIKHWVSGEGIEVERPDVDAFIQDIFAVYERHGMSISHEDGHGAFIIEKDDLFNRGWLQNAHIEGV